MRKVLGFDVAQGASCSRGCALFSPLPSRGLHGVPGIGPSQRASLSHCAKFSFCPAAAVSGAFQAVDWPFVTQHQQGGASA